MIFFEGPNILRRRRCAKRSATRHVGDRWFLIKRLRRHVGLVVGEVSLADAVVWVEQGGPR